MISSHITNKEVMKQNILYPIGYLVRSISYGYMISNQSLHFIYQYDNIIHSSNEVISPVLDSLDFAFISGYSLDRTDMPQIG